MAEGKTEAGERKKLKVQQPQEKKRAKKSIKAVAYSAMVLINDLCHFDKAQQLSAEGRRRPTENVSVRQFGNNKRLKNLLHLRENKE